jgi:hypothetical protein
VRPQNEPLLMEKKTKKIWNREPKLVGRAIKKISGEIEQVTISSTIFLTKVICADFCRKNIITKAACKMLVKLTTYR